MWKPIQGWEEYYSVNENGEVKNNKTNHILSGDINNAGYHRVQLYSVNNIPKRQKFFRHRLVAIHFIDNNIYDTMEVNHIDGDKSNNKVDNLEWCNKKENELHSRKDIGVKEYKPFKVKFTNGEEIICHVKSDLSIRVGVTTACVKGWLHKKSNGFRNYNIESLNYIETNCVLNV